MSPSLVARLLQRGANLDQTDETYRSTALHQLMSYVGSLSGTPVDAARQADVMRRR